MASSSSHLGYRKHQPRSPTIVPQEENRESDSFIRTKRLGTIVRRRICSILSVRNAVAALLCLSFVVARSLIYSKQEAQQFLFSPPNYVLQHESSEVNLSEKAWMELLERYGRIESVRKPKFEWTWMPVVIRGDKLFVVRQHALELGEDNRYHLFSLMIRRALKLAVAYRNDKTKQLSQGLNLDDIPFLDKRMRNLPIPLLVGLGDFKTCRGTSFPRFGWCTVSDAANCVNFALPSFSVYNDAPNTLQEHDMFHQAKEKAFPWANKKQQAVWRGSASGGTPKGWTALPRAQVVNYSILHPALLDAAFIEANEYKVLYPEEAQQLFNKSRFGHWIHFPEFQKYRAIIDVDGNAWSDRFGNLLCMNSVVIKVQPAYRNYFFEELQPWVHYIPVASNMSDMVEALRFAVANESEAAVKTIVHRANEWCRRRVTKDKFASDVFWMLNAYVGLLGTNETRWRQWQTVFKAFKRDIHLVEPSFSKPNP